ncbi:hypothetical protein [Paludibaculum fermentans]|uniref:hypothetical protein n=1 Tax=Paludibaculum fermentans TaxID=1473598 RepID=UPI003EC07BA1
MSTTILISLIGLVIALVSLVISRIVTRRVSVLVHRASFVGSETESQYFITVTNLSLNREVEITHVWFDFPTKVHVLRGDRPLPKRLKMDEVWCTWVPVSTLPDVTDKSVFKSARVRLSNGRVVRSKQNTKVPCLGSVPEGGIPVAPSGAINFPMKNLVTPQVGRSRGAEVEPRRIIGLLKDQIAQTVETLRFDDPSVYGWWNTSQRLLEEAFGQHSRQVNHFVCEVSNYTESEEERQERHARTIAEKKGMLRAFVRELEMFQPSVSMPPDKPLLPDSPSDPSRNIESQPRPGEPFS